MTLRTIAEHEQLVEECRKSGRSMRVWCQERGIPYTTFANWSKKVFRESSSDTKPGQSVKWAAVTATVTEPSTSNALQAIQLTAPAMPAAVPATPKQYGNRLKKRD